MEGQGLLILLLSLALGFGISAIIVLLFQRYYTKSKRQSNTQQQTQ